MAEGRLQCTLDLPQVYPESAGYTSVTGFGRPDAAARAAHPATADRCTLTIDTGMAAIRLQLTVHQELDLSALLLQMAKTLPSAEATS